MLRAGLRELERQNAEYDAKLAALRVAILLGIDDVAAGHGVEMSSEEENTAWVSGAFEEAINPEPRNPKPQCQEDSKCESPGWRPH